MVGIAVVAQGAQLAADRQVEGQFGARFQAGQRGFGTRMLEDALKGFCRDAQLLEQRAQGLARFHFHYLPTVAGRPVLLFNGKSRQVQCQRGQRFLCRLLRHRGKTGHDGGNHDADGGEQAGMDPLPPGPAPG